ncbi:hypothetical protein FNO01nite_03430 [Flavobacterium noncentrifugens]|uniref:Uncharacterized protein n=1 Tax=Flavobacterium noncentrifugens TaxID=1128970 RepID=A0A1G8S2N1_9FLAO|nr:hypothetical protein [Flavobacterium noncentrifugens]GEP49671.1 hypothetical protein FNO01nite_03430 [Flavobacterium noncentrifugens]SDJ23421.1 hypothetical protein SAMN04487935_0379 [Flavobacterium noncentrifugens]
MNKFTLLGLTLLAAVQIHAQSKNPEIDSKYRRSSLYKMMIDDNSRSYADVIRNSFLNGPDQEKFNNHNLGLRTIPATDAKDESANIITFMEANNIARDVVAKWFDRSAKGGFDMELIKKRGSYDASVLDIAKAKSSKRGLDMLSDAGEDLIKNTFILVNDFKYVSKEEVAKKAGGFMSLAGNIGAAAGVSGANEMASNATEAVNVAGKGYVVKTTAHLFRLVWNEETAAIFYNDYWADDKTITPERKKAFDDSKIFKLEYIGSDVSWADVQSSSFSQKTNEQLIERATNKAIDAVIVKLQKEHDEFKTKTPLFTGEPITAKIGLKEGISDKSKFDVMEQQQDADGKTKYVVVGSIKIDDSFPIWDNRYGAADENPDNKTDKTYFKKVSGKEFFPGMLIVQKKGK